ncbi:MAG: hypothetical protein Ct9H300mP28_24650 [Pseudomonadota bacterium]|nr:MAG: hypothetical protein Ct9H300mP28_24650 [Pseudomonadota bacterium]
MRIRQCSLKAEWRIQFHWVPGNFLGMNGKVRYFIQRWSIMSLGIANLVMEETFGPAIPVIRFKDIDDALRIAKGNPISVYHLVSAAIVWITLPVSSTSSTMEQ